MAHNIYNFVYTATGYPGSGHIKKAGYPAGRISGATLVSGGLFTLLIMLQGTYIYFDYEKWGQRKKVKINTIHLLFW